MCESSLFRHLFTQHENICRKQRGTEETGRKVWRSRVFPVLLDRKPSHSLSSVTLKRSSHGLPVLLQARDHKTSQLNAGDRTVPVWFFLCVHFPFIAANSTNLIVFPRVNPQSVLKQEAIKESRPPGWQTQPHVPGRPSRTPAYRRPSSASLPVNTSLVFNVNTQLCTDFFLRTSCGSLTMIAEVCLPLSLLKYGNGIIQMLEPLFSHSWGGTGTQKDSSAKTGIIFLQFYGDSLGSVNKQTWIPSTNTPMTHMYEMDCRAQTGWQLSTSSLGYGDVERGKNFNKLRRVTLLLQCPPVFQEEEGKMSTFYVSGA